MRGAELDEATSRAEHSYLILRPAEFLCNLSAVLELLFLLSAHVGVEA